MNDINVSYSHYPKNVGQYIVIGINLLCCLILLTYSICLFNKASSVGFNIIKKELGIYPLIIMVCIITSAIIYVYIGEAIILEKIGFIIKIVIVLVYSIAFVIVMYGMITSMGSFSKNKVNNIKNMCCENYTVIESDECGFMEKYGCEYPYNIMENMFSEVSFDSFYILILYPIAQMCLPALYFYFTTKMLEDKGKITEEMLEKNKLYKIRTRILLDGIKVIKKELQTNPYKRNCLITADLSVYYRKLNIFTGLSTLVSMIYVGWNIYELKYINGIGFNLFSKDIYITKLVFSIILSIYSFNIKTISVKCKEKKKKGYDAFIYIIFTVLSLLMFYLIVHCFNRRYVWNYSETYDICCINQSQSAKCNFLNKSIYDSIILFVLNIPDETNYHYRFIINIVIFSTYISTHLGCFIQYSTIQEQREKRQELERLLIKLGYEDLVNEYHNNNFLL